MMNFTELLVPVQMRARHTRVGVGICICFETAINRRKGQLCFTYDFACCQPNDTEGKHKLRLECADIQPEQCFFFVH